MKSPKPPVYVGKQKKGLHDPKGLFGKISETLAKNGVAGWNRKVRPLHIVEKSEAIYNGFADANFSGLDLSGINLSGFFLGGCNFSGANLTKADFRDVQMWQAKFDNAILINAKFSRSDLRYSSFIKAHLQNAWFDESNLTFTNFERATLTKVDFSFANLGGSNLKGADISGSIITGVSAWGIEVNSKTQQTGLIIEPWYDPLLKTVDNTHSAIVNDSFKANDIETAQLLYLLTSKNEEGKSEKIKTVIDAMTEKIVLILGRFSDGRIKVLEKIKTMLAKWGYVPVIFDFPKPRDRDLIETVGILAGLSRFVIADLTDPSSTPLEAMLIISTYRVPFAPIIEGNNIVFPLFDSLRTKYEWVLETWRYRNSKNLITELKKEVVDRCEDIRTTIKKRAINDFMVK